MDWEALFEASSDAMRANFAAVRAALKHRGLKGSSNEEIIASFLRDILPAKIGLCAGEIIDSTGGRSRQTDVVAFDAAAAPRCFATAETDVLPVESVYAVFEVKAVLNKQEIEKAFQNMLSIKALQKKAFFPNISPAYTKVLYGNPCSHWPVQFFLIAFESDDLDSVLGHVDRLNSQQPIDKRIDTVVVLDKGLVTNVSPRGLDAIPMPDTKLVAKQTDKALLVFYALLNTLLAQVDSQPVNINEYLAHISF